MQSSISSAAELALQKCLLKEVIVGILMTGDAEIHVLNRDYRSIDKPTDVLSFNGNYIDPESGLEYLGDIIISVPRAKKQALAGGHSTEQEIQLLVIHGILHLCGFDHDTPGRQKKMWKVQSELLNEIHNPLSDIFLTS